MLQARSRRSGRSAPTARRRSRARRCPGSTTTLGDSWTAPRRSAREPQAPSRLRRADGGGDAHSCSSSPTAMRAALAGEIVARLERRGFELRGARLLKIAARARRSSTTPSTRASRSSASLVSFITSGPALALAVARRVGDRRRADDDGRDEPARLGAGHDPRRLRARAARRTSCTARTRQSRRKRELALCSSRTVLSDALPTSRREPRALESARARSTGPSTGRARWPRAEIAGASGSVPESELRVLARRRRARTCSSSAAAPRYVVGLARAARRARRSASTTRARQLEHRAASCEREHGLELPARARAGGGACRSRRELRPRRVASTARCIWSPTRTAGCPRPPACCGPAASSSFLRNSTPFDRSARADDELTRDAARPTTSACTGSSGRDGAVEFHLAHGDWIRLLRANGFEVDAT